MISELILLHTHMLYHYLFLIIYLHDNKMQDTVKKDKVISSTKLSLKEQLLNPSSHRN